MKSSTNIFRRGFRTFLLFISVTTCLIAGVFGWESRLAAQVPVIKNIQSRQPDKIGITNKDMQNICTAAISTLFNRPTSTINVDSIEKGMMRLSYPLPTNSSLQQYSCKIEGKKILLAKGDDAWQTGTSDEQVTFQLTTDEILIIVAFSDGSEKQSRFPR